MNYTWICRPFYHSVDFHKMVGLLNGWVEATGIFTVILAGILEFIQMQRDKDNQSPPGDIGKSSYTQIHTNICIHIHTLEL